MLSINCKKIYSRVLFPIEVLQTIPHLAIAYREAQRGKTVVSQNVIIVYDCRSSFKHSDY